jgi:transcription initiation factor TFIID subunit 3
MTDARTLHSSLLRPAILQILRASGFHAARPSVVEALTSIAASYIHLLAIRTHAYALSNHDTVPPDVTDVRMAMADVGAVVPGLTASEEVWKEILEREGNVYGCGAEALDEVRHFVDWVHGTVVKEQKRIAGFIGDEATVELEVQEPKEDYVTGMSLVYPRWSGSGHCVPAAKANNIEALKKKHSKTGEESRFQGTILGKDPDLRPVVIDGGPSSLREWQEHVRLQRAQLATVNEANGHYVPSKKFKDVEMADSIEASG